MPRQSDYPLAGTSGTDPSDAHDTFLLAENPDPAGDQSIAARVTRREYLTAVNGKTTLVTTTTYTIQHNNEIVLVDTTTANSNVTITVPSGWPDDSKFTVTKIADDNFVVSIESQGAAEQIEHPRFGTLGTSFTILFVTETTSYVRNGGVWYLYNVNMESYSEVWAVAADTPLPLVQGVLPLSYAGNAINTASLLWTEAGGVLTALHNFIATIDTQSAIWIRLIGNNANMQAMVEPVSTGTMISSPLWSSAGSSRAEDFPSNASGNWVVEVSTGQTFQIEGVYNIAAGNGTVDLGDSLAGDSWGLMATFTVD